MGPKKPKLHSKCAELTKGTELVDTARKIRIVIDKEIGQGGFGRIYQANVFGKKEPIIVKIEPQGNGPLFVEQAFFIAVLKEDLFEKWRKENGVDFLGLPHLIANSTHMIGEESTRFLAMPKYNVSLAEILAKKPLTPSDAVKVAKSILNSLHFMHDQEYVHADLKPGNVMFNSDKKLDQAVLIDFGLTKKKNADAEKEDKKKAHNGTPLFTSTDAHRGCNPTYRSDLEILAHNLVYWLTGSLPWSDIAGQKDLAPVLRAKQNLIENAADELRNVIKDENALLAIVKIYEVASKMDYNEKIDFPSIVKILDDCIKSKKSPAKKGKVATKSKKQLIEDDVEEPNTESPPKKAKRTRAEKPSVIESSDDEPKPSKAAPKKRIKTLKKDLTEDEEEVEQSAMHKKVKPRKGSENAKNKDLHAKKTRNTKPVQEESDSNTEKVTNEPDIPIPGLVNFKKNPRVGTSKKKEEPGNVKDNKPTKKTRNTKPAQEEAESDEEDIQKNQGIDILKKTVVPVGRTSKLLPVESAVDDLAPSRPATKRGNAKKNPITIIEEEKEVEQPKKQKKAMDLLKKSIKEKETDGDHISEPPAAKKTRANKKAPELVEANKENDQGPQIPIPGLQNFGSRAGTSKKGK